MQGVEQYAWKKATPLLKNQGKYHSVDQREADLKKCLEKLRAACYIQDMAEPEKNGGDHHRLYGAVLEPQATDNAPKENFLRHSDAQCQKQVGEQKSRSDLPIDSRRKMEEGNEQQRRKIKHSLCRPFFRTAKSQL